MLGVFLFSMNLSSVKFNGKKVQKKERTIFREGNMYFHIVLTYLFIARIKLVSYEDEFEGGDGGTGNGWKCKGKGRER